MPPTDLEDQLLALANANDSAAVKSLIAEHHVVLTDSLLAQTLLGAVLFNDNAFTGARTAFERAVALGANDGVKLNLAKCCYMQEDFAQALSVARSVIQASPRFGEAYLTAADAAVELGRPDDALALLQEARQHCGSHVALFIRCLTVLSEFGYPFAEIKDAIDADGSLSNALELAATVVPIALKYDRGDVASELFVAHRPESPTSNEKKFLDYTQANHLAATGDIGAAEQLIDAYAESDDVSGGTFGYLREKLDLLRLLKSGGVPLATANATHDRIAALSHDFRNYVPALNASPLIVLFHYFHSEGAGVSHTQLDYAAMIRQSVAAAKAASPAAQVLVVQKAGAERDYGQDGTWPVTFGSPEHLMFNRFTCYAAIQAAMADGTQIAFLDTDVILLDDPFAWLPDAGVVLTHRTDIDCLMPYNEGLIVARNRNDGAAAEFFRRWASHYQAILSNNRIKDFYRRHHDLDIRSWRGGQLSLAMTCGYNVPQGSEAAVRSIAGGKISFLPCYPYNFPCRYAVDSEIYRRNGLKAAHLKGERKRAVTRP